MEHLDCTMSRLCNRLMGAEQDALNTLQYTLEEMEYLAKANPEREDIKSCIQEIKDKIKSDESMHWTIANRWGEHFDGISPKGKEDKEEDNEPDGDADDN